MGERRIQGGPVLPVTLYDENGNPAGIEIVLQPGDIEIGAVELKNAATDDRAKVAATASVAEGDVALAVQAPVLGVSTGAAVVTDAAGTIQQYLRGLVKWAFERMPAALGQGTMAQSLRVVVASNQSAVAVDASVLGPNGAELDQRLTVDATVGGVQFSAFHADTTHVFWSSETAECRVTFDGSAPTATNGHVIAAGSSQTWTKALAAAAKFIRTTGVSAVIHASQLKAV